MEYDDGGGEEAAAVVLFHLKACWPTTKIFKDAHYYLYNLSSNA